MAVLCLLFSDFFVRSAAWIVCNPKLAFQAKKRWRSATVFGCALIGVLSSSATLQGQGAPVATDPPASSRRLGPLALVPALNVSDVAWDSNVYNEPVDNPESDITASVRPELQAWLRVRHLRVQSRSAFAFLYFRDHPGERSIDVDQQGRISLVLNRITPYISGTWISARERFGLEIDERMRRHEDSRTAGVEVRLGAQTSVDVVGRRTRLEFDRTSNVENPLFSDIYNNTSHGIGVTVKRQLTPLTSVVVTADRYEASFDLDPTRDSHSRAIWSGMEFKPFALISGNAYVGWRWFDVAAPEAQTFKGLTLALNLMYTLLGATRFTVEAERDLSYSAVRGQHAYQLSGGRASVTHRLGDTWDLGGRASRHVLSYGLFDLREPVAAPRPPGFSDYQEIVRHYTGEIGYRIENTRLAFTLGHQNRRSTAAEARQYGRTYVSMSVAYGF